MDILILGKEKGVFNIFASEVTARIASASASESKNKFSIHIEIVHQKVKKVVDRLLPAGRISRAKVCKVVEQSKSE